MIAAAATRQGSIGPEKNFRRALVAAQPNRLARRCIAAKKPKYIAVLGVTTKAHLASSEPQCSHKLA